MQKISISNLGPVKRCELEINDFTVFTGPQASGKSTIAKSIFFYKNIKNILFEQVKKKVSFPAFYSRGIPKPISKKLY